MKPLLTLLALVLLISTSCEKPENESQSNSISKQIAGHWFLERIAVDDELESQILTEDWKPISYEFLSNGDVQIYIGSTMKKTTSWTYDAQKNELTFLDMFNTPFISKVITANGTDLILESYAVIEGTSRAEKAFYYFKK